MPGLALRCVFEWALEPHSLWLGVQGTFYFFLGWSIMGRVEVCAFDSKWVPPVGGAPSRHTSTGGAADGVHKHRLGDSGGAGVEWCGNTASRAELAIGPPVEQGSGAWPGPIGDADSSGDWPSGARAQDA
jgi:hypothetical protein